MRFTLFLASVTLTTALGCHTADDGLPDTSNTPGSETSDPPGSPSSEGGETSEAAVTIDGEVTWHQHVAPLVAEKCGGCHAQGGIAPFTLETYAEAKQWAATMADSINEGRMPPWGAEETDECSPPAPFKDDIRLSARDRAVFHKWIEGGHLEGDADTAAALPSPPKLELDSPARQLTIPSAATVDGNADDFVCFTLDPEITEDVWLTGTQIVAGNSAIVHHALVFLDRAGQGVSLADENGQYKCFGSAKLDKTALLGAWAPGAVPANLPAKTGIPLRPGDKLVVQVHYHPTGQGAEVDDSTRIDLKWVTREPDYVGAIYLIGNIQEQNPTWAGGDGYGLTTGPDFMIPAGVKDHREENRYRLDDQGNLTARLLPLYVWMVGTHMHYVGTDMKITATTPSGDSRCLVQTPRWDFNWQRGYFYQGEVEQLPAIHLGDSMTMRCTYDNTLENPFVREALDAEGMSEPRDVKLGEETLDEMCLGIFGLAVSKTYADDLGLYD